MEKYDLSIMKIKSKIPLQSPGNMGAVKGNCNNCINAKENEEKIPSAPIIKEDENQVISEDPQQCGHTVTRDFLSSSKWGREGSERFILKIGE